MYSDPDEERRRRIRWAPILIPVAVNALMLAFFVGSISTKVANLEALRLEAKVEVAAQIGYLQATINMLDAKVTRLLERSVR